jgi:putative membrane protein
MATYILVRYLHFLFIFILVAALSGQHLLLKNRMTRKAIRQMARLDSIYGVSAILIVAMGLILWFGVGKQADFYTKNWVFHLKVTLAVILGLLSIHPTVFFMKNRKGEETEEVDIPKSVVWVVRLELLLIIIIPLCATLMAQGIGYFG